MSLSRVCIHACWAEVWIFATGIHWVCSASNDNLSSPLSEKWQFSSQPRWALTSSLHTHIIMYEVAFLGRNESRNTRHNIINARVLIYNPLARILRPANKDAQVSEWPAGCGCLPRVCVLWASCLGLRAANLSRAHAKSPSEREKEKKQQQQHNIFKDDNPRLLVK
jgi:hypothetical protein